MDEKTQLLKQATEELLTLMSISSKVECTYDEKNTTFVVDIDAGEENGLLIGKKGDTLGSLQTILGVLLKQKTGEWNRVTVNIADYREKEEDYLKNLATNTADRAKSTGEPQNLYNLKPWQRRVVHMHLAEVEGIETVSEGEGDNRYLVVRSK